MQPHLKIEKLVGKYALLPGDPKRAEYIADFFEDSREVSKHREFWTFAGKYKGIDVIVTSTGIGCPSASIAVHELSKLGVKTFIRVGTCGAIDPKIGVGDLIIADSAIRKDGTSLFYAPLEYPAIASPTVVKALIEASKKLGFKCYVGTVLCADSFYRIKPFAEKFKMASAFEMECSTIFVQCSISGLKSGAILAVDGKMGEHRGGGVLRYARGDPVIFKAIKKEIEISLEAIMILDQIQKEKLAKISGFEAD